MTVLKRGLKGTQVRNWQKMINLSKVVMPVTVDGVFGAATEKATIKLQEYLGVTPDGLVGEITLNAYADRFPGVNAGVTMPRTATREAAPRLTEVTETAGGRIWILVLAACAGLYLALRKG